MKICKECGITKPITEFNKAASYKGQPRYHARCKPCHSIKRKQWRNYDPIKYRDSFLKRVYGISSKEYDELLEKQNQVCAICLNKCPSGRYLAVDHCHETKRVRGLLCCNCNRAIGLLNDDIENITRAKEYIEYNE